MPKPGDSYFGGFTTQTPSTGAVTAADSLPVVTATHNGVDDSGFTLTAAALDTGRYKVTGTIPTTGYALGDTIQIYAAATVGGVSGKALIDSFILSLPIPSRYVP